MNLYREQGVVLRTWKLGEADRIVVLLTQGEGKVRAVAKGVRKTKSRFGGRLEPFSHVDLSLYRGRELDIVTQAEVITPFRALREDYDRVVAGTAMLEAVDQVAQEREAAIRLYLLLVRALRALDGGPRDPSVVLDAFLLKLMALEGYRPALAECAGCGAKGQPRCFSIARGGGAVRALPHRRGVDPGRRHHAPAGRAARRRPGHHRRHRARPGLPARGRRPGQGLRRVPPGPPPARLPPGGPLMPSRNPRALPPDLDPKGVPDHVAIVMDGNGRWAGAKGLPRNKGHEAGEAALFDTVEGGLDAGLSWLTVYAFSTENWRRPASEVRFLMNFNESLLVRRSHELHEREVRIRFIGRRDRIPPHVRRRIEEAEDLTAGDTRMTLAVALDYGGRDELARAVQALAAEVREGRGPRRIDERAIARHLYAADMPDVDLLIRTSNEYRISNFLLWQIAYAELHFTPVLWPDFNRHELFEALRVYQGRHRRFGAVPDPGPADPVPATPTPGRPASERRPGQSAVGRRPERPGPAGAGLYEQAGFGGRLAKVVGFARARLDGEVVVAEAGGELVGVAAGAVFAAATGWVGGVAVVPAHRRVGLGGALTEAIVEFLEGQRHGHRAAARHRPRAPGLRAARLRPRDRPTSPSAAPPCPARPREPPVAGGPGGRPGGGAGPRPAATGEDRRRLLTALWPTGGLVAALDGRPLGYHLASPWRTGGATIAADPGTGLALLDAVRAARRRRGRDLGPRRQHRRRRARSSRPASRALPHDPDVPRPQGPLGPGGPVRRPQPVLGLTPRDAGQALRSRASSGCGR